MMEDVMVIIPAYNEQDSIGKVLADIPENMVREVIVVDNNSSDATAEQAKKGGATVLREERQGYGYACLKGIEYINEQEQKPGIVLFMDADYSDYPEDMPKLLAPIKNREAEIVIGSRALGTREKGAMMPQQVFGNWLATSLLKVFYNVSYSDLGPFRAITYEKLIAIDMQDTTYGWTVEMQLKAAKHQLKYKEVPVNYRKRIGKSKVTGTLKGTIFAGYKIIYTIFKYL